MDRGSRVTPLCLKLWRFIARHVRTYGPWRCWIGHEAMARHIGRTVRTVGRYLVILQEGGYLGVRYRPNKTSLYNVMSDPHVRPNVRPYKEELKSELGIERKPVQSERFPEKRRRGNCIAPGDLPVDWYRSSARPEDLDGLEEFIRAHEARQAVA